MISPIDAASLQAAMDRFDKELRGSPDWQGWQENQAHIYAISRNGHLYPVKQIISLATGTPVAHFSGGNEANSYLENLGFNITSLPGRKDAPLRTAFELILANYQERTS